MPPRATNVPGAQGGFAPTPQNTPAVAPATALSRPQVPAAVEEDDEDEEIPTISTSGPSGNRAALDELRGNPMFTSMVQGKLASLMGRSSGYVESLPPAVRQRIDGLKGIQAEQSKIETEFQHEILALEKRYAQRYAPLFDQRARVIAGEEEPSDELVELGRQQDEDDEDDDEEQVKPKPKVSAADAAANKGIPEFWLTALKNHVGLSELITENDEAALKFLTDVRVQYLEKPGFKLVFSFSDGASAFFSNKTLEKSYHYRDEVGYEGDFVYHRAEGTKIDWKQGKDLTTKTETKKQRNKNTGQTRVITKQVPMESFFTFFNPPQPPSDDDDEDEDEDDDLVERLELDYQVGEDLKERIIPRAVDFFTGKALRYEEGLDDLESDDLDDDFDDDEDEESDGEEDAEPRRAPRRALQPPTMGVTPASNQDPQECKQQ